MSDRRARTTDVWLPLRSVLGRPTIVDPLARKVTVLIRNGGVRVERVVQGDLATPSLVLPGLAATPEQLWVDADTDGEVESES